MDIPIRNDREEVKRKSTKRFSEQESTVAESKVMDVFEDVVYEPRTEEFLHWFRIHPDGLHETTTDILVHFLARVGCCN